VSVANEKESVESGNAAIGSIVLKMTEITNYIHYNPVKHGYVSKSVDWEYSSIHKYIKNGTIPKDWGLSPEWDCHDRFEERL